MHDDPEDYDLSLLPIGGKFRMCGKQYIVQKVTKNRLYFLVDGKTYWTGSCKKDWEQFCRDVKDLVMASYHGVDAGCLRMYQKEEILRMRSPLQVKIDSWELENR